MKKSLGQHFLTDSYYIQKILESIITLIPKGDQLIEIGPGGGVMTEKLINMYPKLRVLELDKRFATNLKKRFPQLSVIYGNATRFPFVNRENLSLFGNLPYNVSVRIINRLVEEEVENMVFLVQKEVAERLTAKPGTKPYNSETIFIDFHCEAELLFDIPAGAFRPKPKVVSSLVHLKKRATPKVDVKNYLEFMRFIRLCFSQKRKMVRNNLKKQYPDTNIEETLLALNLKETARADEMPIQELTNLFAALEGSKLER
ncbi:MAG: ribosomal RNA small subunit methyltransferase A [Nitrospinae bacterium]|nr:ribosomal RNA small subunit methyltransferase A [Nitrospinota bacterium]